VLDVPLAELKQNRKLAIENDKNSSGARTYFGRTARYELGHWRCRRCCRAARSSQNNSQQQNAKARYLSLTS
jgi:hypothetical protein